mgnify:CR=1 FL=1
MPVSMIAAKVLGKKALGILSLVPPVVWLAGAGFVGVWLYGGHKFKAGVKQEQAKYAALEAKRREQVIALAFDLSVAASRVETVTVTRLVQGAATTKIIKERINVYVPTGTAALPAGFRLLHDAAARDVDPPPPSEIGNAAPVPAQVVAATVADNYREANDRGYKLEAWQEWWKAVEAACKRSKTACIVADE